MKTPSSQVGESPQFPGRFIPPEALVVLEETDKGVAPRPGPTKASAFERLGAIDKNKISILAEDKLLEALTSRAIRANWPRPLRDKVSVIAVDVGVSEMLSNQARAHLQARSAVIMVLDGDQKPVKEIFDQDPSAMTEREKRAAIKKLEGLHVGMVGSDAAAAASAVDHFEQWMQWCKGHVILIDKVCAEQVFLELLDSSHWLLSQPSATNSQFKEAIRSHLRKDGGKSTAEAQYEVFDFLLRTKSAGSPIETFLSAFANSLEVRVQQMFEAAQA